MSRSRIEQALGATPQIPTIDICEKLIGGLTRKGWEVSLIGQKDEFAQMNWIASGSRSQARLNVQGMTKLATLLELVRLARLHG